MCRGRAKAVFGAVKGVESKGGVGAVCGDMKDVLELCVKL